MAAQIEHDPKIDFGFEISNTLRVASVESRTPVHRLTNDQLMREAEYLRNTAILPPHPDKTIHLYNALRREQRSQLVAFLNATMLTRAADNGELPLWDMADELLKREGFEVEDREESAVYYVRREVGPSGAEGSFKLTVLMQRGSVQIIWE